MFSKHVGIMDSKSWLETLRNLSNSFQHHLIVESNSSNARSWVNSFRGPWKMQFYFNEIRPLASRFQVSFQHISRSANCMAYCLAKQGVEY